MSSSNVTFLSRGRWLNQTYDTSFFEALLRLLGHVTLKYQDF